MSGTHPSPASAVSSEWAASDEPTSLRGAPRRIGAEHDAAPTVDVGDAVGRFELRDRLGQGGMGVVFVAHDHALARDVAIKVLRADTSARVDHNRLLREAQALGQLQHPNVVAVHDVGTHESLTYLAMDYVRGQTVRDWLASTSPSQEEIARTLASAGDGIAAAHAAGLLHRDIKPTNLLISDEGRVVVVDFGLARAGRSSRATAESDRLLDATITDANVLVGTPRYMAPELLEGGEASQASDQFAFAVTLFEAVCGYPPFAGRTPRELLAAMRGTSLVVPKRVLAPIRGVLQRGLAPDPAHRFASMAELVGVLRRAVDFRRRRARRRRIVAASLIGAVVIASVAYVNARAPAEAITPEVERLAHEATEAAARARFVYPSPDDPDEATALVKILELERIDGEDADARAQGLRADFARTLTELGDRYWPVDGARPFALDYYVQALVFDPTVEQAALRAGLTPGQRLAIEQQAASGEFSHGELVAAEPLIALAEADEETRDTAVRGVLERRRGERASVVNEELRALAKPEAEPESESVARVRPASPKAGAVAVEPAPKRTPTPDVGASLQAARAALTSRDYAAAERLFRQALSAAPDHAGALIGLSDVFFEQGQYGRALRYSQKAVAAAPGNGGYQLKLGDAYFKVDRYRDARTAYEKAKALGRSEAAARLERLRGYVDDP